MATNIVIPPVSQDEIIVASQSMLADADITELRTVRKDLLTKQTSRYCRRILKGPKADRSVQTRVLGNLGVIIVESLTDEMSLQIEMSGGKILPGPTIEMIQPTIVPPTPSPHRTWHLDAINIASARSKGLTGQDTIVGILDTGVNDTNADLNGKIKYFADVSPRRVATPRLPIDKDVSGHGTHVCGLVVGTSFGVAPDAKLAVASVVDAGSINWPRVCGGINWLINVAAKEPKFACVSASFGVREYDATLYSHIQTVLSVYHVLFIAAIGDDGTSPNQWCSPAVFDNVLSVGATDFSNNVSTDSAFGSNNGIAKPVMVAPGIDVMSTAPGNLFTRRSGTSMAASIVAGAAALLVQQDSTLARNANDLSILLQNLTVPTSPGPKAGKGRLDLTHI